MDRQLEALNQLGQDICEKVKVKVASGETSFCYTVTFLSLISHSPPSHTHKAVSAFRVCLNSMNLHSSAKVLLLAAS